MGLLELLSKNPKLLRGLCDDLQTREGLPQRSQCMIPSQRTHLLKSYRPLERKKLLFDKWIGIMYREGVRSVPRRRPLDCFKGPKVAIKPPDQTLNGFFDGTSLIDFKHRQGTSEVGTTEDDRGWRGWRGNGRGSRGSDSAAGGGGFGGIDTTPPCRSSVALCGLWRCLPRTLRHDFDGARLQLTVILHQLVISCGQGGACTPQLRPCESGCKISCSHGAWKCLRS